MQDANQPAAARGRRGRFYFNNTTLKTRVSPLESRRTKYTPLAPRAR